MWKSDDPDYPRIDVYGSLDELERDFGVRVTDLHRPAVDDLVRPNPDDPTGQSTMRRVPEVLDCWFESGSMPFAQVHYPFENADWFEHHYPGDFIVEYIAQTRGWFYTLHVLATALFDRPAFQTCVSHGIVLGTDGQKASKSLRNYVDPLEMFDTYGADAVRWFLLSSAILRGADLIVNEQGIRDAANQVLRPLWNAWSFFTLYANAEGYTAQIRTDQTGVLDRYVLAKLHDLVATVTDADGRLRPLRRVRLGAVVPRRADQLVHPPQPRSLLGRGRRRLRHPRHHPPCPRRRLGAPLLPFVTEEIYQGLTGERSVHLADWPDAAALPSDPGWSTAMDRVRDVCSAALSIRKAQGLRVRLPLSSLTVAAPDADALGAVRRHRPGRGEREAVRVDDGPRRTGAFDLQVVPAALGPRLGPETQRVIRAVKAGDWTQDGGVVTAGGVTLLDGEYTLRLVAGDDGRSAALPGNAGLVLLDTDVTPALEAEGRARDLVRTVQQARRDAGLHVSDRIRLTVRASRRRWPSWSRSGRSWPTRCWRPSRGSSPTTPSPRRGRGGGGTGVSDVTDLYDVATASSCCTCRRHPGPVARP